MGRKGHQRPIDLKLFSFNVGGKGEGSRHYLNLLLKETNPDIVFVSETHENRPVFSDGITHTHKWIGAEEATPWTTDTGRLVDQLDAIADLSSTEKMERGAPLDMPGFITGEVGFLVRHNIQVLSIVRGRSKLSLAIKIQFNKTKPLWIVGGYMKFSRPVEELKELFRLWQLTVVDESLDGILCGDLNARTGDWGSEWGRASEDAAVNPAGRLLMGLAPAYGLRPAEANDMTGMMLKGPTKATFHSKREGGEASPSTSVIDYILIQEERWESGGWAPLRWDPHTRRQGHIAVGIRYPMEPEDTDAPQQIPRIQTRKIKTPPTSDPRWYDYTEALVMTLTPVGATLSVMLSDPSTPPPHAIEEMSKRVTAAFIEAGEKHLGTKEAVSSHSCGTPQCQESRGMKSIRKECEDIRARLLGHTLTEPKRNEEWKRLCSLQRAYDSQVKSRV